MPPFQTSNQKIVSSIRMGIIDLGRPSRANNLRTKVATSLLPQGRELQQEKDHRGRSRRKIGMLIGEMENSGIRKANL
jgi:hypothetical protein